MLRVRKCVCSKQPFTAKRVPVVLKMQGKLLLLLLLVCGAVSGSITCPDRQKTCPDKQTCCLTERGYKCCPYPNAVCCADQAHCCPFGFICDLTTQMCERSWANLLLPRDEAPLAVKQTPLQTAPPSVDQAPPSVDQAPPSVDQAPPSVDQAPPSVDQAPPSVDQAPPSVVYCDNVYTCPDGYTCCRHPAGVWWCCPTPLGRCCLDGNHCCPYGYDCDATYTHCIRQGVPHPFSRPFSRPSALAADRVDVLHQVSAASTQPAEQAPPSVDEAPPSVDQAPPSVDQAPPAVVYCDNVYTCPNGYTCCRHPSGVWWCCPASPGRCCLDGNHCCPYGYDCDATYTHCIRQGVPHPFSRPFSRPSALAADRVDVLHQVSAASTRPAEQAPPSVDQAPPSVDQAPPSVIYCDSVYTCPNGYTCCRHPSGGWWCCPSPQARCCLDGYHCCPYGYDCDRTYTQCIRQGVPHPFSRPFSRPSAIAADPVDVLHQVSAASTRPAEQTLAALGEEPVVQEGGVIHCDAQFYCPKGSSCCRDQDQQWSCCPYPLGVCCADGRHCCQYGYTCDPSYSMCRKMPLTL